MVSEFRVPALGKNSLFEEAEEYGCDKAEEADNVVPAECFGFENEQTDYSEDGQ